MIAELDLGVTFDETDHRMTSMVINHSRLMIDAINATKDDMAVIANHEGTGIILWFYGGGITEDIEATGSRSTSDHKLDDGPNGINIWEGKFEWQPGGYECPEDGDYEPNGVFRPLTELEWNSVKAGKSPWGENTRDEDLWNEDKADIKEG